MQKVDRVTDFAEPVQDPVVDGNGGDQQTCRECRVCDRLAVKLFHHQEIQAEARDGARGAHQSSAILKDEDADQKDRQAVEDDLILCAEDAEQSHPADNRARLYPRVAMRDEREREPDEEVPLELDRQGPVCDVHPRLAYKIVEIEEVQCQLLKAEPWAG